MDNLDENRFAALADAEIAAIEAAMEAAGLDVETGAGGVLEVVFDDDSRIVVNRHLAAREIWVAAKSGGFHFRPVDGGWRNTRDDEELWAALSRLASLQSGEKLALMRRLRSAP